MKRWLSYYEPASQTPRYQMLPISLACSYFFALLFVVMLWVWLPHSDEAFGLSLVEILGSPFVLATALLVATVSGIAFYPSFRRHLAQTRLSRSVPVVVLAVSAEIVLVTGCFGWVGLLGAYGTLILVLRTVSKMAVFR